MPANIAFYFLRYLGDQSTFGFSNFRAFEKEKTMNGCKVINLSNVVIPYRVGSLFTLVSYYDKITLKPQESGVVLKFQLSL